MDSDRERFVRLAIEEAEQGAAEGNMAVGAVIVMEGAVVARGHNEATSDFDLTAHAETAAIRTLSARLRVVDPTMRARPGPRARSTLYTTCQPCPMCARAIWFPGLSRLVIGARLAG